MDRFIMNDLQRWKDSPYRKPLILKGARQVGKTWVLKEFGKRSYSNVAYFTLMKILSTNSFFKRPRISNGSSRI